MKRFLISAIVTLFVLNGVIFSTQSCFADPGKQINNNQSVQTAKANQEKSKNDVSDYKTQPTSKRKAQTRWRPMTFTEMQTGYTLEQIHSMPILERPDRPGHFIGNTLRWQYRNRYKK